MVPPETSPEDSAGLLRQHIIRTLTQQLEHADWSALECLKNPVLRIEACLEEAPASGRRSAAPGAIVSHLVDLAGVVNRSQRDRGSGSLVRPDDRVTETSPRPVTAVPSAGQLSSQDLRHDELTNGPGTADAFSSEPAQYERNVNDDESDSDPAESMPQRSAISGLRPARSGADTVIEAVDSQRQIHSGDKFPKRRKLKPIGHFLQPSTLDKLIGGIWEQIHASVSLDPVSLVSQLQLKALDNESATTDGIAVAHSQDIGASQPWGGATTSAPTAVGTSNDTKVVHPDTAFSQSNVFCRQVTQASRACRSLEVIVQAWWIEHFEAYVDRCAAANPLVPRGRFNKAALMEACADFGWTEKELRNKMSVWRGYKEIKDAGGWVALVFAGMGIYRFCKYRIGFDRDSMQRLRSLRPALEVAADTLHPRWRRLLAVIGEDNRRVYTGHPHDWVVFLDGADPMPLRATYLRWDPNFSYRHIDESVVDGKAWGCDDPRWTPPPAEEMVRVPHQASPSLLSPTPSSSSTATTADRGGMSGVLLPVCETCGKEQSDDPKLNACYCFPGLFGAGKQAPSPVLVFRTPGGKNNGLLALRAFDRGVPIGEFVGVVTRGLRDVDVMESCTTASSHQPGSGTSYQIWQGRQGNFTRFVNHSCKANAQYQRFTWLNTQRIILVSKGIEAGTEITVDYSDKYWKGLDKQCLCGESCCRYRKDRADITQSQVYVS